MKRFRTLAAFLAGCSIAIALPVLAQQRTGAFLDVDGNAYYFSAVESLSRLGIVRGYDNGRFGPDDKVTRGQVAVMIDRYDSETIEPLRRQIEELRRGSDMGVCGDGTVQTGEECDDGNTTDGDGCSSACQQEQTGRCEDGHAYGDSYIGADGCNTCHCSEAGIACTKMYCPGPLPDDGRCKPYVCADGTTHPSCSEDGHVINYFAPPCLTHGGDAQPTCGNGACEADEYSVCPRDCDSAVDGGGRRFLDTCGSVRAEFVAVVQSNTACRTDADCMLFESSCPFVTCGEAINHIAEGQVRSAADAVVSCVKDSGQPVACAGCMMQTVSCVSGQCQLGQPSST
jgi:cysteine-rich repeat protein